MSFPFAAFGKPGIRITDVFRSWQDYGPAFENAGLGWPKALLISGPSGCGKTTFVSELCKEYNVKCTIISLSILSLQYSDRLADGFAKVLRSATTSETPTVIIIKNAHSIFPAKWLDIEVYHEPRKLMEETSTHPPLIVALTSRMDQMHPAVKDMFRNQVEMETPTALERLQILKWLFPSEIAIDTSYGLRSIAERAHSYNFGDLISLCDRLIGCADLRADIGQDLKIIEEDVRKCLEIIKVSDTRKRFDTARMERVAWDDVGGHARAKELLRESVVHFYKHQEAYARLNIEPSKGVLLYGPPGTGKTMLAKAVATESDANFLPISVAELIKGEVGESEKAISRLFSTARRCKPCIIFIDELEALFARHEHMGDVGKKLFSQLLIEIDELDARSSHVVILAATNHPEMLDPSLIRSGRIDRLIAIRPPSTKERESVLEACSRKLQIAVTANWADIAERTVGMTGADLNELMRRACITALSRAGDEGEPHVTMQDFEHVLDAMQHTPL
ncbi:P-loop containing nucleoside triphosphate hydrolase protein [Phlyctochytrium arcticum]|nr:P-loop containing nucleoside triphosphate hydrolase protein [Phlyctochytrium arcticum]